MLCSSESSPRSNAPRESPGAVGAWLVTATERCWPYAALTESKTRDAQDDFDGLYRQIEILSARRRELVIPDALPKLHEHSVGVVAVDGTTCGACNVEVVGPLATGSL